MTTPAGWYDDGSGRQRWWDGQQWTEHFAPEAAAPAAEEPSVDDTVIRSTGETAATTEAQLDEGTAGYAAPVAPGYPDAAPGYPDAAPGQPASDYPGSAPVYPGTYSAPPSRYPAAAPYAQTAPEGPKKVSVLGLVGLGLGVLGTILVFIPVVGFIGFIVLAAGFIVSLISLFLKGKKWPGITGLILAVVGTIIGIVMSFLFLFAFAQGVSEEIDRLPSSSPSVEATDPGDTDGEATGTGRPTADEVAAGIAAIIASTGAEGYTDAHIACFADEFVASDLDDETLRQIASADSATFTDPDVILAFTDEFTDALPVCLVP